MSKKKYPITPLRFNERDRECIAKSMANYLCETTAEAVRVAKHIASKDYQTSWELKQARDGL